MCNSLSGHPAIHYHQHPVELYSPFHRPLMGTQTRKMEEMRASGALHQAELESFTGMLTEAEEKVELVVE